MFVCLAVFKKIKNDQEKKRKAEEEAANLLASLPEDLFCPVCLDLYFNPQVCQPCKHIFCEVCVRRLTVKADSSPSCPVCRTTIQKCLKDVDLRDRARDSAPDEYKKRRKQAHDRKWLQNTLPGFEQKIAAADGSPLDQSQRRQRPAPYYGLSFSKFLLYLTATVVLLSSLALLALFLIGNVQSSNVFYDSVNIMLEFVFDSPHLSKSDRTMSANYGWVVLIFLGFSYYLAWYVERKIRLYSNQ